MEPNFLLQDFSKWRLRYHNNYLVATLSLCLWAILPLSFLPLNFYHVGVLNPLHRVGGLPTILSTMCRTLVDSMPTNRRLCSVDYHVDGIILHWLSSGIRLHWILRWQLNLYNGNSLYIDIQWRSTQRRKSFTMEELFRAYRSSGFIS